MTHGACSREAEGRAWGEIFMGVHTGGGNVSLQNWVSRRGRGRTKLVRTPGDLLQSFWAQLPVHPLEGFFAPASAMSAVLSFLIERRTSPRGLAGSLQTALDAEWLWMSTEGPVFPPLGG